MMKNGRIWFPLFLATFAVAFYASNLVMAQSHHHSAEHQHSMEHHQEFKVGKKGEITLSEATGIGDQVMEPGRYKFQHREEGGAHFVHFQMIGSGSNTGDISCKLEPLDSKAKRTAIFIDRSVSPPHIVKAIVRGENAAHVF